MHVAVVGGGIVGLASACALAERGVGVTVFERDSLGSGSTERSAGGIRAQFSTPVNVALSVESMRTWDAFESRFGVDIAHRRTGYLFLARTDETAAAFADQVAMQQRFGVPSSLLTPADAQEHCPALHADRFEAATYSPTDGFADPHLAVQGYSAALDGDPHATVRTNAPVTALTTERRDGRRAVTGVVVDGTESVAADAVVNAAGPWAREVAAMAGVDLPVAPRRRQIAVVEPTPPVPESVPLTIDLDTGSYFRPEREGTALVGGYFAAEDPDRDPDRYRRRMDTDWAVEAVERASDVAGFFGPETRLVRGWAGLYAVTPDHHPVVEATLPGFVTAVGFSGHGFQHAPATGRLVADLVQDGEATIGGRHVDPDGDAIGDPDGDAIGDPDGDAIGDPDGDAIGDPDGDGAAPVDRFDVGVLSSDRFERGDLLDERNVA